MSGTIKKNYLVPMSGLCGIGMAAACAIGLTGFAQSAQATLIHEYSFNSSSISGGAYNTPDSIGGASYQATVMGSASVTGGQVVLANTNSSGNAGNEYVSIPTSALTGTAGAVTFEEWFTTGVNAAHAQNLSINNDPLATSTDAIATGAGATNGAYMFITQDNGSYGSRSAISPGGYVNENVGVNSLGTGSPTKADYLSKLVNGNPVQHMVTTVIDSTATGADPYGTLSYYVDGVLQGTAAQTATDNWATLLSGFTNLWLGRSAYSGDPMFNGSINEFRIYNNALSASQVAADAAAGPNTVLTPEPASLALFGLAGASLLLIRRRRAAV